MKKIILPLIFILSLGCNKSDLLIEKTKKLEKTLSFYEISQMNNVNVTKEGLWEEYDLGQWHCFFGSSTKADSFLREDSVYIEKFGEVTNMNGTWAMNFLLRGINATKNREYNKAESFLRKARKKFNELGDKKGIARYYLYNAINMAEQNRKEDAIKELDEGIKFVERELKMNYDAQIEGIYSMMLKKKGDITRDYNYYFESLRGFKR